MIFGHQTTTCNKNPWTTTTWYVLSPRSQVDLDHPADLHLPRIGGAKGDLTRGDEMGFNDSVENPIIPSGYLKIAIENNHRTSGFSH